MNEKIRQAFRDFKKLDLDVRSQLEKFDLYLLENKVLGLLEGYVAVPKKLLPPKGRSVELERLMGIHGEIVVTLNSLGKVELTVYDAERQPNGNLGSKTYELLDLLRGDGKRRR
ncbi:MAG: hypothetical protein HWN68_19715 [Desulfobacterales bacterium]|nr:hypothetical protein [Desulfobacterales bacterium]